MAFEQYFVQGWESIPAPTTESEKASSPCFDCSICLDFARDPVVTLCGHLYCWPCIYKWLDANNSAAKDNEPPKCPVCKSQISQSTIVPLYGRGQSLSESEGKVIPPRPAAIKGLTTFNPDQEQQESRSPRTYPHTFPTTYTNSVQNSSPMFVNNSSSATMASFDSTMGMYGEMVYARVFGNSQSLYEYPNSYHTVVSSTPRLRRQHQQAYRSLNRVSIFLFCFFLLCLLVF
ncbi:E3 ubiquitin-protein ligase RMA1H1-like [Andrographis paniculata]|uniref:E3 ubiquitin-protein ligase RMA1H1-like n=1 Tax=Andrographis paniculata TaxID=175694 RepID=UPI0021E7B3DA|nr:E3 ubiquitin-protein ligase RMA1H1-like [Andrographis paniculata]